MVINFIYTHPSVHLSSILLIVFARQTGGPLDHTSFSLQLPQAAVQLSPPMLLERYKDNRVAFGTLPTGTTPTSIYWPQTNRPINNLIYYLIIV